MAIPLYTTTYHPMHHTDRFQLLFGSYQTPRFEYGSIVIWEWEGEVEIVGITDAKIP